MSGAPVWCAGRIVGVISRHHVGDGPDRLAAVRVERWYDELDQHALADLRAILALPDEADQLADVIPDEQSTGSWRGGFRRGLGVLDTQYEDEVDRWFVEPAGIEDARLRLESDRTLLLQGEEGRGRRTLAVRLLSAHRRYENPIVQLPTHPDRPDQATLDTRDIGADDRLLLDLTAVDTERLAVIQDELISLLPWVRTQRAFLVVVVPVGAALRAALGQPVEVGRPDGWSVLRAHLGARGVQIVDPQPAQGLDDVLDRGRMADLADLAALVAQAKDRTPSADLATWFKDAVAARDNRANDVASQVAQHREGGFRAFLLSAAMLEGQPADVVFQAQRLLLQAVGIETGHELEQPDRADLCRQARVETRADTRLWFTQLSHGRAVRRHFWENFPDLRDSFRQWVVDCALRLFLDGEGGQEVVHRFVDECLQLRRAGDVILAVGRWTRGEPVRTILAARALELGLTDLREGVVFRQQCYRWARDHQLPAPLARVVIAACVDVIVLNYPNQALVRLHHLTFHRNSDVARVARVEILRLAADRRIFRRLLARLTDHRFGRLLVNRRIFLAAAAPDRLIAGSPLVAEKVVRQQLVEGWRAVLNYDEKRDYESVVRRWFNTHAMGGNDALLDVLVEACGIGFDSRATVFAIGRQWSRESGREIDGLSRRATFSYLESGIDAEWERRLTRGGSAS
jgi:hypothetical protein